MNLAWKDISFNRVRFLLTAAGVGAMIVATIGMVGLYRGIVYEALLMILEGGADLWVVQGNTHGPFSEMSRVSGTLDRRVEGVPGVKKVRRFIQYSRQFYFNGRRFGMSVTGLDYPHDTGTWLPLVEGRYLSTGHYEAIADVVTGLVLGDRIRLGPDDYTIVGITRGQVDVAGDGLLYVSIADALVIDRLRPKRSRPARSHDEIETRCAAARPPGIGHSDYRATLARTSRISAGSSRNGAMCGSSIRTSRSTSCSTVGSTSCGFRSSLSSSRCSRSWLRSYRICDLRLGAREGPLDRVAQADGRAQQCNRLDDRAELALDRSIRLCRGAADGSQLVFPHFPRNVVMNWDDIANLFARRARDLCVLDLVRHREGA